MTTIGIVYFSMYGSTHAFAKELVAGVDGAGATAELRRVEHGLPEEVAQSDGVREAIEAQADVATADVQELTSFDGILFGSPTRFGSATSQLQSFLDQTGPLWAEGALVGKPAGFFTGASTIHGGHESTILTMSTFAFHHGMPIVPLGYSTPELQSTRTGGGPYGPTHFSPQGDDSKTGLDDDETAIARHYAGHFVSIAQKLAA